VNGDPLDGFAAEVGVEGPVAVEGGRTQWELGGDPAAGVRLVRAPSGVVEHRPAEMIARVWAGTPVAELDSTLARGGQMVPLDPERPERATVGGVLAVGRSGRRRLRYGPVRDHVLELRYVSHDGHLIRSGAPVVKNVSGFDLVRLLVGSLGTLGLIGEVVLRTYPLPRARRWLTRASVDWPDSDGAALYRPASLLWDGARAWVLLEGHPADVDAQSRRLGPGWSEAPGPPATCGPGRLSMPPASIAPWASGRQPGTFLAEIGVGVVHVEGGPEPAERPLSSAVVELNGRMKARFDPTGRLNPGRDPLGRPVTVGAA
jgi:FAD/FMN-containing dehydrogenase